MTIQPSYAVLNVLQGDTYYQLIQFSNPDGTLVDFTDKKLHLQARQYVGAADAYIDLTTENGGILIGDFTAIINGETVHFNVALNMTPSQTGALTTIEGVYDMKVIDLNVDPEYVATLIYGPVNLRLEITQ